MTNITPKLPPLPLDLDNTHPRISMHVKAGDLVTQLHRWGREVYLAGQSQATRAVPVQRIYMDELDAGVAGEEWLAQYIPGTVSMVRSEEPTGGQSPRVRWVVLFDRNDRLTHGYMLTRDILNWTQITFIDAAPTAQEVTQQAEEAERQTCTEADGCPTERAVLQRFWREYHVTQQAAKAETGGVQAKTWKDAPYKLDHVAEAWARGWNDARAEFAKPKSDLTTVDCPECAGTGAVEAGEACDECDGQAKLIVSRKDLADLAPTTSTVSTPNFQAWGEQFSKQPHEGSHDYVTGWNECVAAAVVALSSSTMSAPEEVRDAALTEAEVAIDDVIRQAEDSSESAESLGAYRCRDAIRALRTTSGKGEAA